MPTFEIVSAREAHLELALKGKRGEVLREYIGYIEQVDAEHAGRLTAGEGETTAAIRRRLGAAADLLGKTLAVTRVGGVVYFWEGEEERPRRNRRSRGSDSTGRESEQ